MNFCLEAIDGLGKYGKNTWQFFGLVRKLISKSSDRFSVPDNEYIFTLIRKLVKLLAEHESNESKKSMLSDQTLQGALDTIADALNQLKEDKAIHSKVVEVVKETDMINILFYRCLFFQEGISENYMGSGNIVEVIRARS